MMKRFHMHISVEDLEKNVRFYSQLFNTEPTVLKDDYAKWALDDPAVNFAISSRGARTGLDHVGIQTETNEELTRLREQLEAADIRGIAEEGANCCYSRSDKYWVQDPQGIAWETFHSLASIPMFGDDQPSKNDAACCTPEVLQKSSGCC